MRFGTIFEQQRRWASSSVIKPSRRLAHRQFLTGWSKPSSLPARVRTHFRYPQGITVMRGKTPPKRLQRSITVREAKGYFRAPCSELCRLMTSRTGRPGDVDAPKGGWKYAERSGNRIKILTTNAAILPTWRRS